MNFDTLDFGLFLPMVFFLYWFVFNHNIRLQNAFVVAASYVFYSWWDWRFLFLMAFSSALDFLVGLGLKSEKRTNFRRYYLWVSLVGNLGLIGFFKYYNFFVQSFISSFTALGHSFQSESLNIILPVGISFYTFQTLSYTIDVYRQKIQPTNDVVALFAFVSFFPQLVAGPIERAKSLLPQFYNKRVLIYRDASNGMRQILWGLFKKMVVADNCAEYVNMVFQQTEQYSASTLLLAVFFFLCQLYADFSGYSDIAIGTAKLFGFRLTKNFNYPILSRSIPDFWRRWHISLTTWFRDYLYIPLALKTKDKGAWVNILILFFTFFLIGLWHGANWTYVSWGVINAVYFAAALPFRKRKLDNSTVGKLKFTRPVIVFFQIVGIQLLLSLSVVFFRSPDIDSAFSYFYSMFSLSIIQVPFGFPVKTAVFTALMILIDITGRKKEFPFQNLENHFPKAIRWIIYLALIFMTSYYAGMRQDFVYFQF